MPLSPSIHRKYSTLPSAETWHNQRFHRPENEALNTMTMLDRMRRHKNWLKWSLALVVLAFVLLYIPDFLRGPPTAPASTTRSRPSKATRSRSTSSAAPTSARCSSTAPRTAPTWTSGCCKQLGIDQRIVQQLIEEESVARRSQASSASAPPTKRSRQRILAIPAFQENGQFIGYDRYRQMLQMQNPPVREIGVRRAGPPQHHRREAAGGADQLDHASPTPRSRPSSASGTRR